MALDEEKRKKVFKTLQVLQPNVMWGLGSQIYYTTGTKEFNPVTDDEAVRLLRDCTAEFGRLANCGKEALRSIEESKE